MKYALAFLFFVAVAAAYTDESSSSEESEGRFRRGIVTGRARQVVLKVLKAELQVADTVIGVFELTAQRTPLVGERIRQVVEEARTSIYNVKTKVEETLADPEASVLGVAEQVRTEIRRLLAKAEEDVKKILGRGY